VNAILECSHASHTTYSWNRYGRFSKTQCHWCLSIRQNMSHFTLPTIRHLKASPGTAIIEQDKLVDIAFIADWKKIGEHRQPTDRNTDRENESWIDYDTRWSQSTRTEQWYSSAKQSQGIRAPHGARAYPWILSKYFPSVRLFVRASVRASVPLQISVGCVYYV